VDALITERHDLKNATCGDTAVRGGTDGQWMHYWPGTGPRLISKGGMLGWLTIEQLLQAQVCGAKQPFSAAHDRSCRPSSRVLSLCGVG